MRDLFTRPFVSLSAALIVSALLAGACTTQSRTATRADASRETSRPVAVASATPAPAAQPAPVVAATPAPAPAAAPKLSKLTETLTGATEDERFLLQTVATLSHPYFEGRSADTKGNRLAAAMIQHHFDALGLKPAFDAKDAPPDVAPLAAAPERTFQQAFSVPGEMKVNVAEASWKNSAGETKLEATKDFNPLGVSGNASVTGPMVYVGYSITEGEEKYSSYQEGDDLTGKIAVMYRFEPMDDSGKSKWSKSTGGTGGGGNWSGHAGLTQKINDAIKRNAAGVILMNPPGADDPRATRLDTPNRSRFGRQVGVPVVTLSNDAAERLIKAADPMGRSALELRKLADRGETALVPLDKDGLTVTLNTNLERQQLATSNVGGILPGKGALADQWIVIGGHYDHLGFGYVGGARPGNIGQLHPGADDNASGTAGVMLLAKRLSEEYAKMPESGSARSILFLAFSSEEMGLLGANHYVKNATLENSRVMAMLNLDMIGRMDKPEMEVAGTGTAKEWDALLAPMFAAAPFKVNTAASGGSRSDHASFYRAGTPVLHFFSGLHRDYHQPSDTFDKVNYESAAKMVTLIKDITLSLATRGEMLTFNRLEDSSQGRTMAGIRVRLGIAPGNYNDAEPGVLVGDVTPGASAAAAGIRVGDRLIKWGGEELANVGAMMERLGGHKPGDVVDLTVVRDGQEVVIPVTLQAREQAG